MGDEGGKPAGGEAGVPARMVLQGRWLAPRRAGRRSLAMPAFAQDGGEEPEIAGIYLIGDDGSPLRLGLRARQRILGPRDRARQLSLARPFQAAPGGARAGIAARRSAARRARRQPDRARGSDAVGDAVRDRRGEHDPQHRQSRASPFQVRRCSAGPATSTSISSAPRPPVFADGIEPARATCSRSRRTLALPLRNPLALDPDEGVIRVRKSSR